MGTPTTIQQIVVIVFAVLPGVSFQFVRERARGRTARDDNVAERVLRAVAASLVLDAAYLIALGPWLSALVGAGRIPAVQAIAARPREIALTALLLMIAVPAVGAWVLSRLQQLTGPTATMYRATTTAWAYVFARRESCFVRIRLGDGTWVGGWYGAGSLASSHPAEGEIFLESSYRMGPDGTFLGKVNQTGGVLVRADAVEVLEFVLPEVASTPERGPDPTVEGSDL